MWLGHPNAESMHHRGGAFSETILVYGRAIDWGLEHNLSSVVSVGLGLGYNEILSVCKFQRAGRIDQLQLQSFESQEILSNSFICWVFDNKSSYSGLVYDSLGQHFSNLFAISVSEIKAALRRKYENKTWQILGKLDAETILFSLAEVWLYDAFSSKTSPELWTQEFLESLFLNQTKSTAVVSTYACTGNLKRALEKTGFAFRKEAGFQGKRNSSFATRSS